VALLENAFQSHRLMFKRGLMVILPNTLSESLYYLPALLK
jgi:hypothetical protein